MKQKFYVVWQGVKPGIYESWEECKNQVDGFIGAKYKSFTSLKEANKAFEEGIMNLDSSKSPKTSKPFSAKKSVEESAIIWDSISVDAACSGNPGDMEYRGVNTKTKVQIFHESGFPLGTNNIGEFLAIVHGLALLQKKGYTQTPIYTDSVTALGWVKKKKANTKLIENAKTKHLHELIVRAEDWLKKNTYKNPIIKWNTEKWGEIPADFGRK